MKVIATNLWRSTYGVLILALFVLVCGNTRAVAAQLSQGIWVFEDTTTSLSIQEVVSKSESFVQTAKANFGRSASAFWIRVVLENQTATKQTQVVQFHSHIISNVEAYVPAGSSTATIQSGRSVPRANRSMPTLLPSFPIDVDAETTSTVYFRIESPHAVSLGYDVKSLNEAIADNTQFESLRFALILSFLVLLAYNVASAIITRQVVHWLYVGFVSLVLFAQLIEVQILTLPLFIMPFLGSITFAAGMAFLASLHNQFSSRVFRWIIAAYLLSLILPLLTLDFSVTLAYVDNIVKPIGLLLLAAQVVNAAVRRKPYSRLIFIGWMAFFVGAVLTLLAIKGNLPSAFLSAYAVGSIVEATVFSIALAYRLRDRDKTAELLEQQRRSSERQKEMFAVVGHELRTPVAAISMVGRDTDIDAETAREQIVEISENLLSVLEDLRIVVAPERALESKREEICDPVRTINRALSPLSQLLKANSIELLLNISKPEGLRFSLHTQPLRQVVTNLTKNAAIHSGGSVVRVSFDYHQHDNGDATGHLRVEDDGRGIPEALQEKVFQPFGRGNTQSDGSGLGLFIVKQIASMIDGVLEYSTSELGGACFYLTFPMKKVEAIETTPVTRVTLEGLRILLAEDDALLRMLTEKSLGKLGAHVSSFDDGQKALAAYQAEHYDLVLTDLMMPMMNGHELTKALRAMGSKTPVIGVTAAVIGEETDSWLRDGASAFISKPITPEKLQSTLALIGFTPTSAT